MPPALTYIKKYDIIYIEELRKENNNVNFIRFRYEFI